jgi:hypothetical protein
MTASWNTTLDAFDSHLDLQAELVERGRYDEIAAFAPPSDLPALPRVLAARAAELLIRAQALTERAGVIRDRTSRQLAQSQSRPPVFAQRPVPVYVDQQV